MFKSKSVKVNKEYIMGKLNNTSDLVVREFKIDNKNACVIYINTLSDSMAISRDIIGKILDSQTKYSKNIFKILSDTVIANAQASIVEQEKEVLKMILIGNAVLLIDGQNTALSMDTLDWPTRPIQEPPTEISIKGPRNGFNEDLKINMMLLRRDFATSDLVFDEKTIGKYTQTKVVICYLKSIAHPDIVREITKRLDKIQIDGVVDSTYIQQALEPKKDYLFNQCGTTERPDVVKAKLLEGRVAIIVDGSPLIITLPFIIFEDFQNPDDYYTKPARTIFVRLIRFLGVIISLFLPSAYVAIHLFHYKVLPLRMLLTISNAIEGIPMTPFLEVIFIILLFEILYEAGLRMPKYLGSALSIVGGIIIGDMSIKSGLVSPPALIVVALSGLTIYTVPEAAPQLFILRLGFVAMGAMLGFLGVVLSFLLLIAHLADLDSYGTPYLAPFAPKILQDSNDILFKSPLKDMETRPKSIPNINSKRMK